MTREIEETKDCSQSSHTSDQTQPLVPHLGMIMAFALLYLVITVFLKKIPFFGGENLTKILWGIVASALVFGMNLVFTRIQGTNLNYAGVAIKKDSLSRFSLGMAIGFGMFSLHLGILTISGALSFDLVSGNRFWAGLIAFSITLGFSCAEELGCRGYFLRAMSDRFGTWTAVIATSVVFGVTHLIPDNWSFSLLLGTTTAGLVFGMAAYASRGLALPIAIHAAWNFGSWIVGDEGKPGIWRTTVNESATWFPTLGLISYMSVMLGTSLCLWWWGRSRVV